MGGPHRRGGGVPDSAGGARHVGRGSCFAPMGRAARAVPAEGSADGGRRRLSRRSAPGFTPVRGPLPRPGSGWRRLPGRIRAVFAGGGGARRAPRAPCISFSVCRAKGKACGGGHRSAPPPLLASHHLDRRLPEKTQQVTLARRQSERRFRSIRWQRSVKCLSELFWGAVPLGQMCWVHLHSQRLAVGCAQVKSL